MTVSKVLRSDSWAAAKSPSASSLSSAALTRICVQRSNVAGRRAGAVVVAGAAAGAGFPVAAKTIAAAPTDRDGPTLAGALVLSVVPSLAAWLALLLPPPSGLWVLLAGFAGMLYLDVSPAHAGAAPPWYRQLRWPLSCLVLATLVCGCLA